MPTQVQFRRGTTAQNNNFVGASGEITVDTSRGTIRVHDNSTPGGSELVTVHGTSSYATNIVGGLAGSLPYQSGAGATDFIPIGASNTVLVSDGSTATWQTLGSLTSAGGVNADNILVASATAGDRYLVFVDALGSYVGPEASTALYYNVGSGLTINSTTTVSKSILPANNNVNLGSLANPFKSLYVTSGTVYIGGVAIESFGDTITINSSTIVTTATVGTLVANTATNIAGGTTGQFAYQSAPGTTAFVSTGSMYVGNTVKAEKWATSRTVSFSGGDVTGSFSIDGSADVSNVVLTVGGNTVALGTDTTGVYVATAVAGTGIAVAGSGSETSEITITNLGVTGLTAGTGIATNGSTGSLTLTNVGVIGLTGGGGVTVSSSTGSVTLGFTTSTLVQTASNLAGGSAGQFAYQTGAGQTAFVSTGSMYVYRATQADTAAGSAGSVANALTIGSGLSGGSFNGSSAVTITNLGVTSLSGTAPIAVSASTGSVTVSLTTASTYVANSVNAEKWQTPRTFTFGGDLTGSMVVDGSQNVTFTATIAADSVALGTDTTGNYVATGATSGYGLSGSSSSEGGAFTVTSNATSSNTASTLVFRDGNGDFSARSVTLTGDLVVQGTTFTVNSTVTNVSDPIITIGSGAGGAAPIADDNKDRGVAFQWHNGTNAKLGFFGYKDSTGYLTFVPDATITNEVVSGTAGDIQATNFRGALIGNADTASKWQTPRTFTFGGDLTGSMVVDGSQNVTFTATIAADSVALGTDTTGNYVAGVSAGTAIAVSGSGSENATVTITNLGVGSITAGTGIATNGSTGTLTLTNVGVTGLTGGGGVTVSASTGSVTLGFTTSTLVQTASNLAGGSTGQFAYQSAPGTTAFVSTGSMYVYRATQADTAAGSAGSVANALTIGSGLSGGSFNGSSAVTITNLGVTQATAGTGIATNGSTGSVTFTNVGVTQLTPGTGIATNGSTGSLTLTNIGVTSLSGTAPIAVSASTGSVTVSLTTASTYVDSAVKAEKWRTARTFTFGGDLSGSMVVDGSQDVTFTATIVSDGVALGTDTTGVYIATASAGTGIAVAGSGVETAGITITNVGVTQLAPGTGIATNGSTGSLTLTNIGVTQATAGTGIATNGSTGSVTFTNVGVTGLTAGTGIATNGSTGSLTLTNIGVTSITGTAPISASASTGSVTLSLTTASTYVANAVNAEKWQTPRTFTFGGDLTGSMVVDGSQNVTFTATIAADSVALGTDTTGNYVGGVSAGTAIAVSGSGAENATVTITNLGVTGLTAGTGIATNGSTGSLTLTNVGVTGLTGGGGVTVSSSTGSVTLGFTTSTLVQTASNLAGGAAGSVPYQTAAGATAMLAGGSNGNLLRYFNNAPTWSTTSTLSGGTADATQIAGQSLTVTGGGAGISGNSYFANNLGVGGTLSVNSTNANTGTNTSNAIYTAGGAWIDKSLVVGGNTVFQGTVSFQGTATYVYSTQTLYSDNLIQVHAPPGATPSSHVWTTDDGFDVGHIFHYYKTTDKDAFLGWKNGSTYLEYWENGTESSGVYTGSTWGTFRTGAVKLVGGAGNAGNTSTGDLTVLGGVGVGGGLYVGGTVTATSFVGAFAGTVSGNADTASKWQTARTFTFGGDLTGSMVVDGSQNVTFTATIAADSVALGTDTTGNYIATASAGTGIAVSGSGSETAAITITNLGVTQLTPGTGIATNGSTGSLTLTNVGVTSITGTAPISASASTGSVTLSLTTASTYVANSVNAEKWLTSRTVTFAGGDVTGSFSIDGSANVSNVALTIGADSVALGTDTTGNYVATATAGTGISVAGSGSETAAITITNLGVTQATAGTGIATNGSTGSVTFTNVGVTGLTAGTGIATNGSTGSLTLTNVGVTALTGGGGVTVNASTGSITLGFTTSTLVQTASNIAGGSQGQIHYQSAAGTTAFVNSGTTGQFLQATTNGAPTFTSTGSMYVYRATQADSATGSAGSVANALTIGSGLSGGSFNGSSAVTITNLGVTSLAGTAPIAVSASTGSVTVSLTTASTYVANSVSAEKWATARTVTFAGGDVTGSFSIDGSANVSNVVLTVGGDTVALGTDTTGNYVATASAGTGIAVSGSGSETAAITITNLGVTQLTPGTGIATNGSTGSLTLTNVGVTGLTGGGGVTVSASTGSVTLGFTTSTLVQTASNLAGGTAGQFAYQSAPGTTAFVSTGSMYVNRAVTADSATGSAGSVANALTIGSGLSGGSFNGSSAVTITNLGVTSLSGTAPIAVSASTGSVTVSLTTASTYVNRAVTADTASKVTNALTIGTALSGGSFDGSTAITINNLGVTQLTPGTGIATNVSTGSVTLTNVGVTALTGGGGVTVSASTGSVTLGFTTSTLVQTASNLAGGTAGQIHYQTAPGTTAFAGPGTAGQLLMSAGASAPVYTSTSSIYVNRAVTADNLVGGSSISGNLTITGNLVVQGVTTTVDSTVTNIADPIITIGGGAGGAAPASNDSKDRGVAFQWHNGTSAKLGFFGYKNSTGFMTFVPDATVTNEVVTGTKGALDVNLAGGTTGQLHYQSAANTTAFVGPGTAGQILVSGGAGAPVYTNTSSIYVNRAVTADSVATLTIGTGLSGTSYNGSAAVTINNLGVTSLTGTANQVTVSASTGSVTLSLPQSINSGAAPTFAGTNFTSIPNGALTNSAVTVTAGTGLSGGGSVSLGSSITLTNAGVTSNVAGTGISVSGATGAVTITNTGVTSLTGGGGVTVSAGTGGVTLGFTTSTLVQTASNLAGGAAGSISYQTAAGTTAMLSAGTAGQFLRYSMAGGAAPVWSSTGTFSGGTASSSTVAAQSVTIASGGVGVTGDSIVSGSLQVTNSLGIGTGSSGVAGEIRATNEITAYYSSDARLKENVVVIGNALEKLDQIRGVYFDWTDEHIANRGGEDGYFVRKHDVGVIAQEIEAVLPEVVADRDDGFKAVKYEKIVPLLIAAIKEQQQQIAQLSETINKLANK